MDSFEVRINRSQTVEEHIQLSLMYKQFFASELEMLCSMPEFFRKVTLLYTGGDDFALCGSWDALIPFGRELQRLFHRFVEANVRELAGPEGKTISMALAIAGETRRFPDHGLRRGRRESPDRQVLGQGLRVPLRANPRVEPPERRRREPRHHGPHGPRIWLLAAILYELAGFYRGSGDSRRGRNIRLERPWRFHRRLNRVINVTLSNARNKEFQKLRADLISDFTGRNAAQIRLRPAGRVALEWAKLETEA